MAKSLTLVQGHRAPRVDDGRRPISYLGRIWQWSGVILRSMECVPGSCGRPVVVLARGQSDHWQTRRTGVSWVYNGQRRDLNGQMARVDASRRCSGGGGGLLEVFVMEVWEVERSWSLEECQRGRVGSCVLGSKVFPCKRVPPHGCIQTIPIAYTRD
jgi:hypothetical protein